MLSNEIFDGARSALWMSTAQEAPATEPLCEVITADVVIIGAGFTGLNAALELSSRGVSVCVLEAGWLGFGASGRSGGQVNIGLNLSPAELLVKFGENAGNRLIRAVAATPDTVFERIERFGLRCDPVQNGWVQSAATQAVIDWQVNLAEEFASHGCDMKVLNREQASRAIGSDKYLGGLYCPTAGTLQPLSYTRELARVAIEQGVQLYTESAVTHLVKTDKWQVHTAKGSVSCDKVLICTNGYTSPQPINGLEKKVVPVRSVLAATEPLSEALRSTILPGEVSFVDKRRLVLYMRYDRDGRLCCGDHGPMRDTFTLDDFVAVKKRSMEIFPALRDVRWDFHWGGRVAMTKDTIPFLTEIEPGLVAAMGYNGRGVGMGTVLGVEAGRLVAGLDKEELAFPVSSPKAFALHRWHKAGVGISIKWFAMRDHLESVRS